MAFARIHIKTDHRCVIVRRVMKVILQKKVLTIAFFLLSFALFNNMFGEEWRWLNPLPQGNPLYSVYFTDEDTGYVAGVGGTIIKTTDAGESWTILSSGTTNSLYSIYFTDANTGYAVGVGGTILKNRDNLPYLTLIANPEESGIVEGGGEYLEGEEVEIIAEAGEGWEFVEWTGGNEHVDDPGQATATVTMLAEDVTLTAKFDDKVAVKDIIDAEVKIFPNSACDKFYVESSEIIRQIRMISISG